MDKTSLDILSLVIGGTALFETLREHDIPLAEINQTFYGFKVKELYGKSFKEAAFVVEHAGWREDQWPNKESISNSEECKAAGLKQSQEQISLIEKLLEPPIQNSTKSSLSERIEKLRSYFS